LLRRVIWLAVLVPLLSVREAEAQPTTGPIPRFVVDARGSLARFKKDPAVAEALRVPVESLPAAGLGLTAGAHWYALRLRKITFGIGGEVLLARDSATVEANEIDVAGPTVTTQVSAFAPQISFNFGRDEGWSYISGGLGSARLTSERGDVPVAETAARTRMLNYGGGARWFNSPRMAFTFDVRFYAISPRASTTTVPGYPRAKFMVLSGGVAFK
jgi:hypothetical protein